MANALANLKVSLPTMGTDADAAFNEVAKGSDFLPRIQLITKGKYVDTGKIAPGHYGVPQAGGEEIQDLGESIDLIPWAFRPKAMDVSDREAIVTSFDVNDDEFKRIQGAPKDSGCMWGPVFLVYERTTGKFYEMFWSKQERTTGSPEGPAFPSVGRT